MNVDAELDRMKQAIFTEDLLTKLLSCSQKHWMPKGTVPPEGGPGSPRRLEDLLTPSKNKSWPPWRKNTGTSSAGSSPFARPAGLCTGFQQYFLQRAPHHPLPGLVTKKRCWIKPSTAPATRPASRPRPV